MKKPIALNLHRESRRPQYSYFRYGLNLPQMLIFTGVKKITEWKRCFELIDIPENFNNQEAIS